MAQSLIDAYLAHDSLSYPILHNRSVSAAVDAIYADPTLGNVEPFDKFMFHLILAITNAQIHKFNWQVLPDAVTHHQRAMAYLDPVLCGGGSQPVLR